jgi:hypothetical protein
MYHWKKLSRIKQKSNADMLHDILLFFNQVWVLTHFEVTINSIQYNVNHINEMDTHSDMYHILYLNAVVRLSDLSISKFTLQYTSGHTTRPI